MKFSYKKLLIFQLIIFIIFILNSFVSSILKNYGIIVFLVIVLIIFKFMFGFEKDRHRYTKDIIFNIFIILLVFFLLYYISGIIITFARIDNYYTLNGLINFIIPTILLIILKEFFRYMMLKKSENSKLLILTTFILFLFLDLTNIIYFAVLNNNYQKFIFIALTFLPAITENILCTYLSLKVGYKPAILYLLVMNLYGYLIPIIPNPNEYIASIVNLLLPLLVLYNTYLFFDKAKDQEIERDYKKVSILAFLLTLSLILTIVYFTSGYFRYYIIAIASGSMQPNINKGDLVIIEKIKDENEYKNLQIGQVIAYNYGDIIVVHRLVNIVNDKDEYYFYTKGDANNTIDNYPITEDMIIGTVNLKIPFIGYPTVWVNEL
ncbi:MAG: signal peptidase I [Bacilli bacterium]|nr:signal peptidase I [Bacilli bacterium]